MRRVQSSVVVCAGILLLAILAPAAARPAPQAERTANHSATMDRIVRYLRERFNMPATVKLTVGPFNDSPFREFYETTITVDDGKQPRSEKFYVSKDERYLIEGTIFTLAADPKREIERVISLQDQPTQGPATAPVTIVEYADLECPQCARLHEILENDVVPKYGEKIRIVFKEFPLTSIHEWAMTAALAQECVYQIDPAQYVPFRTRVFANQATLTGTNARDMLLHFAAETGIDNMKLAACIDNKASLSRVEASRREGEALGVNSTPTSFVNGHVVVGAPDITALSKIIDEALHAAK